MRFYEHAPAPDLEKVRAAWREFVTGRDASPREARAHILRAWKRSAGAGCDHRMPRADVLPAAQTVSLLRQESRLVDIASPFMAALSRAAGADRHAAMLADGNGRLLKVIGDAQTVADENFPRAGSRLSEANAGANGIGSALAEGGYVELVGPEHFIEGFHVYTCQGVPLLGPDGKTVGVLSTSVRRMETANRLRDIMFCASESAECELLSAWLADLLGSETAVEPTVEALRQDMVQRIATARLQLELGARQIAAGVDASTTMRMAYRLSEKFRRQAAVWRNLAETQPGAPEPVDFADLVQGMVDLLETELRVAGVGLAWRRDGPLRALDDVPALSQRLLSCFLSGIHAAGRGSDISMALSGSDGEAVLEIEGASAQGEPWRYSARAPLLS